MVGEFKLLVLVHDGETKSYLARHPAFERTVLLHLLPSADSPERKLILDSLERISPEGKALILDRGERDGQSYLVTQRQLDFHNLVEWLQKLTLAAPPAESPRPPIPQSQPGEFTQLFVRPEPVASAAPSQPVKTPGEFTQMFSPAAPNPLLDQRQQPRPPLPTAEPYRAPVPPPQSGSPPKGEFTKMFEVPLPPAGEPFDPRPPAPKPVTPPRPAFQADGAFTQVFGRPVLPSAQPPTPLTVPPAPILPSTESAKPEPQDEFREQFGPSPEAHSEAAPLPPPAAATPLAETDTKRSAPSNLPIILILAVLVIAAIALIGYFALRRPTSP